MKKKIKGKILAEGEVTGHAHRLEKSDVYELEDGTRVFEVLDSDTLHHEEHHSIKIPKGKYRSGKVLEYDHFTEEARKVAD